MFTIYYEMDDTYKDHGTFESKFVADDERTFTELFYGFYKTAIAAGYGAESVKDLIIGLAEDISEDYNIEDSLIDRIYF
jgi:hypothetical protein